MQLDTRLPLAAAAQAPITFQPESRMQTLSRIAPGINAMRQLQAQQIDMQTELRKRQAFDQFRSAAQKAGLSGDLGQLAQVFFTHGQSAEHFKLGTELMKASQEEARNRRLFGPAEGGEPTGTMPAATLAAAAPATIQAPASEVAPEMDLGATGGAQPRNAMMAMEAPTAPAAPAAPTRAGGPQSYLFAGRTYPAPVVQEMLARPDTRSLGLEIIKANEQKRETTPEKLRLMQALGYPMTQEGFAAFEAAQRAPTTPSEISKLQAEVNALPANDPQRKPLQDRINMLTTRPEPVQVNVNQQLERKEQQEKGALNVELFKGIATAANVATRTLPALETQERVLNAGFQTGFGTEAKKIAASILSALGVPEAERSASSAETFVAAMNQAVLQRQLEQKGTQTRSDADRITATGAQLGNTVQGNRFIIAVAKAQLKRDISQRRFWEEYWRKNKTYEGAEEAWEAGPGGKSLFDAPELREFVQATTPPAAPRTGGAGAARPGGAGAARPSGGGVDRNNPLLRQE